MKKIKKIFLIVLIVNLLTQWTLPSSAMATDVGFSMWGGTALGQSTPAADKGNPEGSEFPSQNMGCSLDPILINSGEFTESYSDFVIPSRAMPLEISRTYRSQRSFNNRFGYGWYFNFYMRLQRLSNGNMLLINGETTTKVEFTVTAAPEYTSPNGTYQLLRNNGDGTHTLTNPDGLQYIFDLDGKLTFKRDRYGNQISYEYDVAKLLPVSGKSAYLITSDAVVLAYDYKLIKMTDTVGRVVNLDYYADGRLKTITDFAGRVLKYEYTNDNLTKVTKPVTAEYPSGVSFVYTYDANHNLQTAQNARNQQIVLNKYDTTDRVYEQTYCGGTATLAYDTTAKKTTVTDRKGFITIWTYDAAGHITQKEDRTAGLRAGEPTSYITKYTYNQHGEISSATFPRGNMITYSYDSSNVDPRARGNVSVIGRRINSTGTTLFTQINYESRYQQVKRVYDSKNYLYQYTYDYELLTTDPRYGTKGSLVTIEQPAVSGVKPTTNMYYNSYGQITKLIDPNNNQTEYDYYPATGYLKSVKQDGAGINALTQLTYDTYGNIDTITDAENHPTNFDYNELNQLAKVTSALGFQTKYFHDEDGNVKQIQRQVDVLATQWQITNMTYTAFGKIETLTDPLLRKTTYGYDNNQNLASVLDSNNKLSQYLYDERNLLFKALDANTPQGVTQHDYDINGNLVKITDAKAQVTNYTYDLFDRLTRTTYADAKFSDFVYDNNSNLITHITPSTKTINYVFDELNRLRQKNFPLAASLNSTYTYDIGSRLTDANNVAASIHYNYDKLNRVDDTKTTLSTVVYNMDYDYYKNGLRKKIVYPSTRLVEYTYDNDNQLDLIKVNGVTAVDYNYDPLGRRLTKTLNTGAVQQQSSYSYDLADQLASVTNTLLPSTKISQYSYPLYDNAGNRKQLNRTIGAGAIQTTNYTYNNVYELTAVTGAQTHSFTYDNVANRKTANGTAYVANNLNQYTTAGAVSFTYDGNSNMSFDGVNTLTYDEENRLATATKTGSAASYAYDAFNRRVSKTVNGTTTVFVYDNDEVIADYTSAGSLTAEYLYGSGLDEVVSMQRGATSYFYHYDGLGSVAEVTNAAGSIVERYDYDPYGKATIFDSSNVVLTASAVGNRYMFTGRELDAETGNYHYRARIYNPTIGRFLQRDPIGYADSMNLFQYTGNNPTNYIDPHGLVFETPSDAISWQLSMYYFATEPGLLTGASLVYDTIAVAMPFLPGGGGYIEAGSKICKLAAPKMIKHHLFNKFRGISKESQKYRDFFKTHNINVDDFTVQLTEEMHRKSIHQAGNNWTTRIKQWIDANPNASTKEVYQYIGSLMDEYGINHLPIGPYK